jgi:hypothetical protein
MARDFGVARRHSLGLLSGRPHSTRILKADNSRVRLSRQNEELPILRQLCADCHRR